MAHAQPHPQAGQTVTLHPLNQTSEVQDGALYRVEDYWDRLGGGSWMDAQGNPAAIKYAVRTGMSDGALPLDDEVVYGKIGSFGHIVHISELGRVVPE